ncbi:hypothetical protein IMCC21224_112892 [Puniceibacterium sp. IMCC21224]|nr:hypothetical protein IMCC21224_112892 [Puniceibacterium sp. IMCC21224]
MFQTETHLNSGTGGGAVVRTGRDGARKDRLHVAWSIYVGWMPWACPKATLTR